MRKLPKECPVCGASNETDTTYGVGFVGFDSKCGYHIAGDGKYLLTGCCNAEKVVASLRARLAAWLKGAEDANHA